MGQSAKKIILIIAFIVIGLGLIKIVYPHIDYLRGDSVERRISIHLSSSPSVPLYIVGNGTKIRVNIAETEEQRAHGLSNTSFMDDDQGMLFIFETPAFYSMWMKDMLFPLDIIWLDKDFKIVEIKKNLSPSTYPETFTSSVPARYVLEINGGLAEKYGFKVGDEFDVSE